MISIIVPTLNEEKTIVKTLESLVLLKGEKEIIVVDGGSSDNTIEKANKYAKVIKSKKGRANQMNAGAKKSKGDILWFVHSDSLIEDKSLIKINELISKGYAGGGFKLYFYDLNTKFIKFVEISSNLRGKFLKLIYGDQGIFVKKHIFEALNGFKTIKIMEDLDFSIRLKKQWKVSLIDEYIGTSARRFKNGGEVKTLLLMHKLKILYALGVNNDKLAKIYKEER